MNTNHLWSRKERGDKIRPRYERFKSGLNGFQLKRVRLQLGRNTGWVARISLLGNIGWAIIAPTLLGVAFGLWIDTMYPSHFSWMAFLLLMGLLVGCIAASYWFRHELTPKD